MEKNQESQDIIGVTLMRSVPCARRLKRFEIKRGLRAWINRVTKS